MWVQAWLNKTELTNFHCEFVSKFRVSRAASFPSFAPGGPTPADLSNSQVKLAVDFAVSQLTSASDGLFSVELHQFISGTKQVNNLM